MLISRLLSALSPVPQKMTLPEMVSDEIGFTTT